MKPELPPWASVKQRKKAERMSRWKIHQPTKEWETGEGIGETHLRYSGEPKNEWRKKVQQFVAEKQKRMEEFREVGRQARKRGDSTHYDKYALNYFVIDSPQERRLIWDYLKNTKPLSPLIALESEFQAQVAGHADRYFNRLLDQVAPKCHLSEMPLIKSTRPNGYAQRELNR